MKKNVIFAVFLCGAAAVTPVRAVATEVLVPPPGVSTAPQGSLPAGETFTIRVKAMPLSSLLDIISQHTHASFSLADPGLANWRLTMFIKDIRLDQALEIMRKTKNLDFQRVGGADNFIVSKSTIPPQDFPPLTQQDLADPLLNRMVSVRVKEAPLATFLDVVSEQARVNFIITGEMLNVRITALLEKVTIVDVLQFLKARGFSVSRVTGTDLFIVRQTAAAQNGFSDAEGKFGDKKYEEAVKLYKELADKYPDSEMADYALLMTAINYDWIAARDNDPSVLKQEEETLQRLIHDYPKSTRLGDAYLYLGQIYSGHGGAKSEAIDCKKALELYNLAIKRTYRDWVKAQAETRIAQCYERGGEKAKALEIYRGIIKKYPAAPITGEVRLLLKGDDPLFETGLNLEKQKEYELAIGVYKRIASKGASPQSVRKAELRVGVCQTAMGDTDSAVKTFEAYFAKYDPGPEDAAYSYMGTALEKAGRSEEARKYLDKAKSAVKTALKK